MPNNIGAYYFQNHSVELVEAMDPRIYRKLEQVQKYRISSILEEFSEDLMDIHGKCMDIGCGPGNTTKELLLPALGSNTQIIGTDISEKMIKYANLKFRSNWVEFEVLDIQTKNLPKKYISQFDHIFSFHTIHWCNDIPQVFKNIYQMLQPNGTILLNIITSHDIFEVLKILAQDIRFAPYIASVKNILPYQNFNNIRKELKELVQSVGFTVHHCSLRDGNYFEEKPELFLRALMSILPFLEDIPQDLIEEFKNAVTYEYTKRNSYKSTNNNKEFTLYPTKWLLIYAQKI